MLATQRSEFHAGDSCRYIIQTRNLVQKSHAIDCNRMRMTVIACEFVESGEL